MKVAQSVSQSVSQSVVGPGAIVKPEIYRDVVADLRRRGAQYFGAANELERLAGLDDRSTLQPAGLPVVVPRAMAKRMKTLKARLTGSSGTSALVLAVMRGGADTLAAIAKGCKVKPGTARAALLALEDAGRVNRQGKSRATRYLVTK